MFCCDVAPCGLSDRTLFGGSPLQKVSFGLTEISGFAACFNSSVCGCDVVACGTVVVATVVADVVICCSDSGVVVVLVLDLQSTSPSLTMSFSYNF